MPSKLFWFPTPADSVGMLRLDSDGVMRVSKPDTHPTGRTGISWTVPDSQPDKNGAQVTLEHADYYEQVFRGLLDLNYSGIGLAGLLVDDSHLTKKPDPCPEVPVPPIPPPHDNTPIGIINSVYATGKYNLATYDGCGQFTEACCTALHEILSDKYGHLQKFPPQNHYPADPYVPGGKVHAVDAIQLLVNTTTANAGIYDIITNSESSSAAPAFNNVGTANLALWYYPAK